jgi:hypothetical protein
MVRDKPQRAEMRMDLRKRPRQSAQRAGHFSPDRCQRTQFGCGMD